MTSQSGYITKMAGYFCFYLFFRGQGGGGVEGVDHKARLNMFSRPVKLLSRSVNFSVLFRTI
jgi:hypothetical protein